MISSATLFFASATLLLATFCLLFSSRRYRRIQSCYRRNEAIFNNPIDGIFTIDKHGIIQDCNATALRLFGYRKEELVGRNVSMLIPSPHCEDHDRNIEDYLRTGKSNFIGVSREVTCQRKDETTFPAYLAISETAENGEPFFTGFLRNISDIKRTEQNLIDTKDAAERASRAKSEFLSSMSHELRTPLNAILGFTQLLENDDHLQSKQRDNVKEIRSASDHLLDLINDVLELSQIESGTLKVKNQAVSINELMEDCITYTQPLAQARRITLNYRNKLNAETAVRADARRIKQVILNLLTNAIKYNSDPGRVDIECQSISVSEVRISVKDTGPGITPARQEMLFQPFNRLGAEGSNIEGTGIGLVIAKRLAELMGGNIGVISDIGVGSTFWIDLQRETATHTSDSPQNTHVNVLPEIPIVDKKVLLYIEDNPANIKFMTEVIALNDQLTLLNAPTGELGLELAACQQPQLILLDINLPDINGIEVMQRLRRIPATQHIPVIAVSANAMPEDIERCKHLGLTAYITKPIDVQQLLREIGRCLGETHPSTTTANQEKPATPHDLIPNKSIETVVLHDLVGKNREIQKTVLEKFVSTIRSSHQKIADAIVNKSFTDVNEEAQRLHYAACAVGAMQLADHCKSLTDASNNKDWASVYLAQQGINEQTSQINSVIESLSTDPSELSDSM